MSCDVGLDETDDRILVKMLWETRVYVMQNFKEFTEVGKILTSWIQFRTTSGEGQGKGNEQISQVAKQPRKLSRYVMLPGNLSDVNCIYYHFSLLA